MNAPATRPARIFRGKLGRVNFEPANRTMAFAAGVLHRGLRLLTRPTWLGGEHIPATGPVIFVPNHISSIDPPLIAEFLVYQGRWPHFLARANLFDAPVIGRVLRDADQIPVLRGSSKARDSLVAADAALEQGHAVVIYPEGTITFDPAQWPMAGHTGAARLALRTGAPIIPIGQWGASFALPPRGIKKFRPKRWPVTLICGEPIDLGEFAGRWDDRATARAATVKIMDAITALVEQARGEQAPELRWHQKHERLVERDQAVI